MSETNSNKNQSKRIQQFLLIILLVTYTFFLIHKINLTNDDLGRHIKNGEIVLNDKNVLFYNYYSQSESNYRFINHHWLSGLIYYSLFLIGSFNLLIWLKVLTLIATFILFNYLKKYDCKTNYDLILDFVIGLLIILVLIERTDVRPEIFSYLFIAIYIKLLQIYQNNKNSNYLKPIPFLQIIWVNLHIYSFIGLLIISFYVLEKLIQYLYNKSDQKKLKDLKLIALLFAITILISLLNPNTLSGLLYPANILKTYGYEIVENKTPFYINTLSNNISIEAYVIVLIFTLTITILNIKNYIKEKRLFEIMLIIFACSSSIFALRNITIMAFIVYPILLDNTKQIITKNKLKLITIFTIISIISLIIINNNFQINKKEFGLGLTKDSELAKDFIIKNNITGQIFNNYDIGSYLIMYLFPNQRPYVDNRPEAYSIEFFDEYKELQYNINEFNEKAKQENITVILFNHNDNTPWAQSFLSQMIQNKEWFVAHIDKNAIIILKKENYEYLLNSKINNTNILEKIYYLDKSNNINDKIAYIQILKLFGNYEIAITKIQKLMVEYPKNSLLYLNLASIYSQTNNIVLQKQSILYYNKAIILGQTKPSSFSNLGLIYFNIKDYENAKKTWQKGLKYYPGNTELNDYLNQLDTLDQKYNLLR